jgi:hypothetical protein
MFSHIRLGKNCFVICEIYCCLKTIGYSKIKPRRDSNIADIAYYSASIIAGHADSIKFCGHISPF